MTFETLERIRLYVSATGRASKVAAHNCHGNGYHEVARKHENEAALSDLILRELANEKTEPSARTYSPVLYAEAFEKESYA